MEEQPKRRNRGHTEETLWFLSTPAVVRPLIIHHPRNLLLLTSLMEQYPDPEELTVEQVNDMIRRLEQQERFVMKKRKYGGMRKKFMHF